MQSRRIPQPATAFAKALIGRLVLSSALVVPTLTAPMLAGINQAHAACDPAAANNVVAICTGDTVNQGAGAPGTSTAGADGYGSGTETDVTITVVSGASVTGDLDSISVEAITTFTNDGTITGVLDGVASNQGITTLINRGVITGGDDGVEAFGNITTLINSGTISGLSTAGGVGVDTGDILGTLTNSGTIIGGNEGMVADDINSLNNTGTISGRRNGIRARSIASLNNRGSIIADNQDGIDVATTITSLTNSGTISGGNDGVAARIINSLTNTGTISGGSLGGVRANETIVSLTNSGTISGNHAILEPSTGGDTTVTLNTGSVLIGRLNLGGGVNTLNIGEGLSLNSTFESVNGGVTLVRIGDTAGHLFAVLDRPNAGGGTDRQVVAVDTSAFTSVDDALAALTAGIGHTVQGRQAALRTDPALGFSSTFANRFAAAEENDLAAFSDLDRDHAPQLSPNRFWIESFGSYREDDSDRVGGDFDHLTGGLVAGVDVPLDDLTSVGVIAGVASSTSENETDTQTIDAMSYYAGVYASTKALGLNWDASLTVGYTDYEAERITANNLVASGLETARADHGGWFVTPQLTVTREATNPLAGSGLGSLLPTQRLEQSLTLAYAGLFLDGYTETDTTNPLTLDDRSVHIASARAALAIPFEATHADGAQTTLRLIGGVEARTQFGDDDVSGTLLGQSVSTTLDDEDATLGGFLGLSGGYETVNGLAVYANAEGLVETSSAYQLSATVGLRIAF